MRKPRVWKLEVREDTNAVLDEYGEVIAYSPADVETAMLLAAAPRLLQALIEITDELQYQYKGVNRVFERERVRLCKQARKAISKAGVD